MESTLEAGASETAPPKRMKLRHAGTCRACGTALDAGVQADYHRSGKTVTCVQCPPLRAAGEAVAVSRPTRALVTEADALPLIDGVAGASAVAEHQRRHDKRRERVTTRHPRAGRLLLAVFDDPQTTQAWAKGAVGEQQLGAMLAKIAGPELRVLHDRGIPGSRANIDHLIVAPTGVYVVDAKRYRNQRPDVKVEGGLFTPRRRYLTVGGRDRTTLIQGASRQVELVRAALADSPDVPVRGYLCFLEADWGLLQKEFSVDGIGVASRRMLRRTLTEPGPLDAERIADLQWDLHEAFPGHA